MKIIGIVIQITNDDIIFIIGDKINIENLDFKFIFISFPISLIASAIGWTIPINETLLGPFRVWKYLIIFRSISVKNATLISTIRTKITLDSIFIIKFNFF